MPELPRITAEQVITVLAHFGFTVVRTVGPRGIRILEKPKHPYLVSIPPCTGKKLKQGTLLAIAKDAGLTAEEFANQITLASEQQNPPAG